MDETTQDSLLREAVKNQDTLTVYAYGVLGDWGLAEDAVQESLIVVNKRWQTFEPGKSAFAWFRGIVRLKALDMIRSRQKEISVADEELFDLMDQALSDKINEAAVTRTASLKDALRKCMGRLTPRALQVLLGFYRDTLSGEQLAEDLRMSHNAVRLTLTRTRKQLRECATRELRTENP